ncbi:hypothetical protein [Tsukamurella sp. PLM1]|uniref:hypothetical protein n=1 Tax=Tsukamurella sp. PLM1 TaxID=2929795 RepID=UPI00204BBB81|nr:hypothetical protein [Tsukamurella sp. PLM1]BDH56955.1 hypothetical protein MTP03_18940 [Tsukamurella sp. PLM1]
MVWVPGAAAAYPVRRSDAWLGPGPGMILPVAVDPAEPERITLIDDRDALADGPHLSGPSEAEIECPPPTVAELLDAVRDAGHGVFPDERHFTSLTDLQWAVALRLGQLSLHEAHRISVLGAASDVVALRERLETVGPVGSPLIHRPSAVEDALAHLPRGVIGAGGLAGSFAAFAAVTRLEARGLRGRLLGRTDPADLTAALAPFVTVCGPIPGVDVVPLAAPSLPEPAARTPMARGAAGPGRRRRPDQPIGRSGMRRSSSTTASSPRTSATRPIRNCACVSRRSETCADRRPPRSTRRWPSRSRCVRTWDRRGPTMRTPTAGRSGRPPGCGRCASGTVTARRAAPPDRDRSASARPCRG